MWKGNYILYIDDYRYILFTMISLWRMLSWNQIVSLPRHSCHSRPAFTPSCCDHPKRRRHKIHDHFLSESSFHDVGPARGWASCNFLFFFFFYGNLSQKKIVFQYLCGCFLCLSSILDFRCTVGPLSSWMQLSLQLAQSGKHRLSRKWLIYASVICNLSRVEHSWTLGISLACMA